MGLELTTLGFPFWCSPDWASSLTQGWSSTVDVYTRSDIEAHKLVLGCYQSGKFEPHLRLLYISHLLPPSHSFILILTFCLHQSLHLPFCLKLIRMWCGIKWYIWCSMLCLGLSIRHIKSVSRGARTKDPRISVPMLSGLS